MPSVVVWEGEICPPYVHGANNKSTSRVGALAVEYTAANITSGPWSHLETSRQKSAENDLKVSVCNDDYGA